MKKQIYLFLLPSLMLVSCEFKCNIGKVNEPTNNHKKVIEKEGAVIFNGIELAANKVKLNKAYLVENNKSGKSINENNFIDVKEGVKLMLIIDSGWTAINNSVWLGASMKVTADNGEVLMNKQDMFEEFNENGISINDSKFLALSVFFTEWYAKRPVSLDVTFNIWDKKGEGSIIGKYRVHTK
ncbi:MAG: hypothetical protein RIR12_964 [Bacteroidota bacterium]|jgi:hypothetical protein